MSDVTLQNIAHTESNFGLDEDATGESSEATVWVSASRTDLGRVRHINEDALLELPAQRLWLVADGMGGQSRGDYASNAVVNQIKGFVRQISLAANLLDLEAQLIAVNEQCRSAFRNKRPGTTIAAMLAHGNHAFFLWAGDSRVYRIRGNQLEQLTQDHTVAQEKHARGELTKEEEEGHPSAHILTRAVGVHKALQLDLAHSAVEPGDRFLLCSDGLYNPLAEADVQSLLREGTTQGACDSLVDVALAKGGPDNITAIVVDATAPSDALPTGKVCT